MSTETAASMFDTQRTSQPVTSIDLLVAAAAIEQKNTGRSDPNAKLDYTAQEAQLAIDTIDQLSSMDESLGIMTVPDNLSRAIPRSYALMYKTLIYYHTNLGLAIGRRNQYLKMSMWASWVVTLILAAVITFR